MQRRFSSALVSATSLAGAMLLLGLPAAPALADSAGQPLTTKSRTQFIAPMTHEVPITHEWPTTNGITADGQLHTVILNPATLATSHHVDEHWSQDVYCPGWGPSVDHLRAAGPNEVLAGYDDYYDPGTGPFNCDYKNDVVYRGGVKFDLNPITHFSSKLVVSARLLADVSLDDNSAHRCNGTVVDGYADTTSVDWTRGVGSSFDGVLFPFDDGNPGFEPSGTDLAHDVVHAVAWPQDNNGWILHSANEPYGQDSDRCIIHYRNPRLEVSFIPLAE